MELDSREKSFHQKRVLDDIVGDGVAISRCCDLDVD